MGQTPTNWTTINRNLSHEPKMKRVQVNDCIVDSKRKSEDAEKVQETSFQTQIAHQGKDLIGIHYMHIVWNVHFEAVSLTKTGGRGGGE